MAFKPLEMQDCLNIVRMYERGLAYTDTEEGVIGLSSALLVGIRTQTQALLNQFDAAEALESIGKSDPENLEQDLQNLGNLNVFGLDLETIDPTAESDENTAANKIAEEINAQVSPRGTPSTRDIARKFLDICFPCIFRIDLLGALGIKVFIEQGKQFLLDAIEWMMEQMQQILSILKLFNPQFNLIDICALIKHLTSVVCIPDMAKIVSVLGASQTQMSVDLDPKQMIMMGLMAPLVTPILLNLVTLFSTYTALVLDPLECIIASLISAYDQIAENVGDLFNAASGEAQKSPLEFAFNTEPINVPFTNISFDVDDTIKKRSDARLSNKQNRIDEETRTEQKAVQAAAEEYKKVKDAANNANTKEESRDPKRIEKFQGAIDNARSKYKNALSGLRSKQNEIASKLNNTGNQASAGLDAFRSIIMKLVSQIRQATGKIKSFFNMLVDELNKMMFMYTGEGDHFVTMIAEKIEVIQMLGLVTSIIASIAQGLDCFSDDDETARIDTVIPANKNLNIWTDEDGVLHIEEKEETFNDATRAMVEALGQSPSLSAEQSRLLAAGKLPLSEDSRQRIESLIELTGDPIIDMDIARATEMIVKPVKTTFKCPLLSSVNDSEQVNKWIEELNEI